MQKWAVSAPGGRGGEACARIISFLAVFNLAHLNCTGERAPLSFLAAFWPIAHPKCYTDLLCLEHRRDSCLCVLLPTAVLFLGVPGIRVMRRRVCVRHGAFC